MALIPPIQQRLTPSVGLKKQLSSENPMHFDSGGSLPMSMAEPWFSRRADSVQSYNPGGLYTGSTGGRTDNITNLVPAGAYVVPADVVSGLGEGTTHAGAAILDKMFHSNPHGVESPRLTSGRGVGIPSAPRPFSENNQYAKGGATNDKVPVITASGEYLIHPDALVAKFGSLERGHKVMDDFVIHVRKKTIKEMKKLKPPVGAKK